MSGSMFDDGSAGVLPGTTGQLDFGTPGGAGTSGMTLGTGTGQHGTQTVNSNGTSNPFVAAWTWLNTPFKTPMSPSTTFLLVGVVLVAIIAWNLILYHIRIAAEAI
jgi:hypothetical protein